MVLNSRNPLHVAGVVFMLLFLLGTAFFRLGVSLEYREAGRVEFAWGDGEGQIPVTTSRDGTLFGARCFCTGPRGVVFVADWARGRVLKFDGAGELMDVLDLGRRRAGLDDMTLLQDGTLLIADNTALEIIAVPAEGEPRPVWSGKNGDLLVGAIESVQAGDGAIAHVVASSLTGSEFRRRLLEMEVAGGRGSGANIIAEAVAGPSGAVRLAGVDGDIPAPAVTFLWSRREGFYVAPVGAGSPARVIRRYLRDGSLSGEFRIQVERPADSLALLGDDRAGRLYVGVALGTPGGRILVFRREGSLSAEAPAPYEGKTRSMSYARVDGDGNLYILEAGEHGGVIRRMAPAQRRFLVRR